MFIINVNSFFVIISDNTSYSLSFNDSFLLPEPLLLAPPFFLPPRDIDVVFLLDCTLVILGVVVLLYCTLVVVRVDIPILNKFIFF